MAATLSSVWSKPGAWALDSEQHEDELHQQSLDSTHKLADPPVSDYPSLSAALTSKPTKKKNQPHTFSLSQFSNYTANPKSGSGQPDRLTPDEILSLPTGPRERTAEELERNKLGGGFRNYGDNGGSRSRVSKEGYNGNFNRERDMGPSRADEVDDWSKTKKFGSGGAGSGLGYERRDKGGFFNSSRADEVDGWASGKRFGSSPAQFDSGRRERRVGFESYSNGSGPDSDNWVRRKEERGGESDTWGRRREENGNERPRLNLQPRTLPVVVNNNGQVQGLSPVEGGKGKGGNPFGEARPREEVLKEKGKDWKEIDEKLDALKVKEVNGGEKGGEDFGKRRGFGIGRSDSSAVESAKTWRKPVANDAVASNTAVSGEEGDESVEVEATGNTSKGDNDSGEN